MFFLCLLSLTRSAKLFHCLRIESENSKNMITRNFSEHSMPKELYIIHSSIFEYHIWLDGGGNCCRWSSGDHRSRGINFTTQFHFAYSSLTSMNAATALICRTRGRLDKFPRHGVINSAIVSNNFKFLLCLPQCDCLCDYLMFINWNTLNPQKCIIYRWLVSSAHILFREDIQIGRYPMNINATGV